MGALIHFSVALVEVIRFLSANNMYQTQSSTSSLINYLLKIQDLYKIDLIEDNFDQDNFACEYVEAPTDTEGSV